MHRRLPTNDFLASIGVKESLKRSFRNEDPESLHQLLWSCSKAKYFWDRLLLKLKHRQIVSDTYVLERAVTIGLKSDLAKSICQLDYCFLVAREYIWLCKTKRYVPELNGFLDVFKSKCTVQETSETENVETKYQNFLDILFPNATR